MIEPGDEAPDFALRDQDGREVKLSHFLGAPVVVYFYPKANTPGPKGNKTDRRGPG
jgi:peroxiredoxin Q/BCP